MPRLPRFPRVLVAVLALALLAAGAAALTGLPGLAGDRDAAAAVRTSEQRIQVRGGPEAPGPVSLDTTLYLPETTPAPAVLVAHGFGGDKTSVDADARDLAARGFVVLAWTARGFGASTGRIALDSPDHEVADARQLVDWLSTRPEVVRDGPGDPRVGVTGGSYGGALSLLLAGYDRRIDALAPVITWNDLGQALFPEAAAATAPPVDTPARGTFGPDGVFKRGWAGFFFAQGATGSPAGRAAGADATPLTCGRFTAQICAAYTEAATTGLLSPATAELLRRSSPASVTDRITAPTLIVQGERDTLFGLDHADANARQIAAAGGTVRVVWYAGGHDGEAPGDAVRAEIADWFDHYLAGRGDAPGAGFAYAVRSELRTNRDTPTERTVVAEGYPGLPGAPPVPTESIALAGPPQPVVHPAAGSPAAITALPGVGGQLGDLGGRLAAVTSEIPGQSARFRSEPLPAPVTIVGAPRAELTVSRVPGQPGADEAVLFGRVSTVSADGRRTLLGGAVAPMRIPVPADGSPARVTITLPGVVAPVRAGDRIVVSIGTTDQGYASPDDPAVWRIELDGALSVPVVPGRAVTANTVPIGYVIGIGVVLAIALGAGVAGWIRRRRRPTRVTGDPDLPLEITGLAKTYRGGVTAVSDVSFSVERGMVLGLLGPNGAGKTTALRMLMGLVRPSAGAIRAFGEPIGPGAPVLARIGAFVEGPGFLPHLSGHENLRLYWAATGRPAAEARLQEALEIAGLGDSVHRRVGTYSQGMRQRLAIAQAMLGLPELLVLDEPTNGLDPPQIHAMREVLRRYAAAGRTVLVSSHLLAEVEQTCTHVVVMHHGRVVAAGTVEEIIAGGGAASFTVDAPQRAAAVIAALEGVRDVAVDGTLVHAELNGAPRASVVRALVTAGIDVQSAGPRRRLEDAFLQLVGEDTAP
ncbi:alpha/beta fold hydrolase [Pseudonocardia asaccharolytica]|uniref:alpha/beta fold hydrolase n=1 Tax=Pseudonocardia asaccharolytica TaxID=54010 RepID=UPI0035A23BFD